MSGHGFSPAVKARPEARPSAPEREEAPKNVGYLSNWTFHTDPADNLRVHSLADIWLTSLYVISFGALFAFIFVHERRHAELHPRFVTPADQTAMEALTMMRTLIHQLGNNAHELALQFDLALSTSDPEQQQQIREQLRHSLHRFINITHEVSQVDARLTGYQPPKDRGN